MSDPAGLECQRVAAAVAAAVDGTVRVVPTDYGAARAVAWPSGSMPVLVVEYPHLTRINALGADGAEHWDLIPGGPLDCVPAAAATATAWATAHPERVSLIELALELAETLGHTFGETWDISIPGTFHPTEMWLHGVDRNAASVGVFDQRVVVWIEDKARTTRIGGRRKLLAVRSEVVAGVQAQHALYHRNRRLSDEIQAIAGALVVELGQSNLAPQGRYQTVKHGSPSHDSAASSTIVWDHAGASREAARVTSEDGRIKVHAGLEGRLGWERILDGSEVIGALVAELARAFIVELTTLTLDRLVVGRRYRVLEGIGGLVAGTVVTFVGFDDIDNHHGRYDFQDEGGHAVGVSGDFSSSRSNPLAETYRYLAEER